VVKELPEVTLKDLGAPTPAEEPEPDMYLLSKEQIHSLDDVNLVRATNLVSARFEKLGLHLNDFERRFLAELPEWYIEHGISWKQRKTARTILVRIHFLLAQRAARKAALGEMLVVPPVKPPPVFQYPEAPIRPALPIHSPKQEELTPGQIGVLQVLSDGEEHPVGAHTKGRVVSGVTAKALAHRNLVDRWVDKMTGKYRVQITAWGKAALESASERNEP